MARYSEEVKAQIVSSLKAELMDCIKHIGIRKTPIDELVERVNIPKGTFYLFYPSKEELALDVIYEYIEELHNKFYEMLENSGEITIESLSSITYLIIEEASQSFLIQIARNKEMELLNRKLSAKLIAEKEDEMEQIAYKLYDLIKFEDKHSYEIFMSSLRLLFYSRLNKNDIGNEFYRDTIKTLIEGIYSSHFK